MKKMSFRAGIVLLIAFAVIAGLWMYILRYIDHGADWAVAFTRANSGSTAVLYDRNGERLAAMTASLNLYAEDRETRRAVYHAVGDYTGQVAGGMLQNFSGELAGFSLITGMTREASVEMHSTLDASLCRIALRALGDYKGCVAVINYETGEIPVLVSTPTVDPLDTDTPPAEGAYINRVLGASFTPGSVFKLVTAACAIENMSNLSVRTWRCEGEIEVAGVTIACSGVHGTQSFEEALSNSCNCAFAEIAIALGQNTLRETAAKYGLLSSASLEGARSAAGSFPADFVGDPETGWAGVGQSTDLICPYTMLRFVAAVGNGGTLVTPHLLQSTAAEAEELVAAATAERLRSMMRYNAVSHYDSDNTFPGLRICAKTGTAETGFGTSHSWFVGFLDDAEHPYAFVVLAEQAGSGLRVAGAIANTVLQAAVAAD